MFFNRLSFLYIDFRKVELYFIKGKMVKKIRAPRESGTRIVSVSVSPQSKHEVFQWISSFKRGPENMFSGIRVRSLDTISESRNGGRRKTAKSFRR